LEVIYLVRALRGAITIENNIISEVIDETKELLHELINKNDICIDDVISIIFTVTKDIDAAFPAVAARQLGWGEVPLMCMSEIDVEGSLKKCIRILMHINTDKKNKEMKHVYLKGATVLRPDLV
jgi:chorismate mutase